MKPWYTTLWILLLALIAGSSIAANSSNTSFEEEVIKAEMKEAGPQFEAALLQYPHAAPQVFALYGHTAELREAFSRYGHNQIVPIIELCLREKDNLIALGGEFEDLVGSLLGRKLDTQELSAPMRCGWRTILLTLTYGNDFLGQFMIDPVTSRAKRLPTNSILANIKNFTIGGLQQLERKLVQGESPELKDWGFAAIDVAIVGAVSKAVKLGISRAAAPTVRSRLGTLRTGMVGYAKAYAPTIAKYATIGGAAYLVLYHPQLITSGVAVVAEALGIPPFVLQVAVWTAMIFILLWIIDLLLRVVGPVWRTLGWPLAIARRKLFPAM
jgi:hypothetical protein